MIKFLIQIIMMALLFTGCGSSTDPVKEKQPPQAQQERPDQPGKSVNPGDSSSPQDGTHTGDNDSSDSSGNDNGGSDSPQKSTRSVKSFTLATKNVLNPDGNKTGLNGFHIKIERAGNIVYDNRAKPLEVKPVVNQDDSVTFNGLYKLETGDKITFEADGFIPQQKTVDQSVAETLSMTMVLKPVDSRQTFVLGDLDSGRVTSRYTKGASVHVEGQKVTFKTDNGNVALRVDKAGIDALIKRVKRSPKADKNTEIYLDITSIDPKTELDSAIGDLSYAPSFEPVSSRSTRVARAEDTMLESVVMTSITMTTSNGDEIHCFGGGTYDEDKEECIGDTTTATLRMKIPASQFDQYAQKYNEGDKVVPLYHYSKSKATWVRQLDSDGNPIDAELVLEDSNNDKIANDGDTLYLEGEVGHFSYWNGDYPIERTTLTGFVEIASGAQLPDGTVVVAEGADYTGRVFRVPVSADNLSFTISAKANAKVRLYLRYPNGTFSDAKFVTSPDAGEENDIGTIVCDFQAHEVTVTVVDTDGNPLPSASVKVGKSTHVTDKNGKTTVLVAEDGETKVTASYDTGDFVTKAAKFIDSDDTLTLDTTAFTISGDISFKDQNGEVLDSKDAYVEVIVDNLYKRVYAKNGHYAIKLPANMITAGSDITVNSGIYVPLYARTMTKEEHITADADAKKAQKLSHNIDFKLEAFIVSGRVINPFASKEARGLAGVSVYSGDQATQTDADGYYEMVLFDKEVAHKIYAYDPATGELAKPSPLRIDVNPADDDLKGSNFIIDKREAIITGSVVNMRGVPVQGIVLYTGLGWYKTTTDEKGNFEFHLSDRSLYGEKFKIYAYDSNDPTNVLATKELDESLEKGKTVDLGDIVINNNLPPVIDAVSTSVPMLEQPMAIEIKAHDPENDALAMSVEFDGETYDVIDGKAEIIPTKTGTLTYTIKVRETDTADAYETVKKQSFLVHANAKPIVDRVSGFEKAYDKKADMLVQVQAYDPEGSSLTYSAKLLSFGMDFSEYLTVQNSTFTVSKELPDGLYILKIEISDGVNTVEKSLQFEANGNTAPYDLNISKEGQSIGDTLHIKVTDGDIVLKAEAKDAENDPLVYEWQFNEGLATADGNTLTIHPAVGVFMISVYVTDGEQGISKTFKVVIAENLKPVIKEIRIVPSEIVKVGDHYEDGNGNTIHNMTVTVDAYDPEETELSYKFGAIQTLSTLATDAEYNNTKVYDLTGIPAGRQSFKVEVTDADGKRTIKRKLFTVKVNNPPVIDLFFVPVKTKAGETLALQTSAKDPEGKVLTYLWKAILNEKELVVNDADKAQATLVVPQDATGKIIVTLRVSDGTNEVIRKRFVEVVQNGAPVINLFKVLPTVVKEGKTVRFSVRASDPEFDELYYTWFYDGEELSDFSDHIAGQITAASPGDHNLTVEVSDGDKVVRQSEKITVNALAAKPVVTLSAAQNVLLPNAEVTINANVEADSSYTLKWFGEGLHGENLTSALFSASQPGDYTIGVIATNVDGIESDKAEMVLHVKDIVADINTTQSVQELGNDFLFTASLSDGTVVPTNAVWTLVEKPQNSAATLIPNGVTATLTPDVTGIYKVAVSFSVTNIAGTFEATKAVTVKEAGSVGETVEGVITDSNGDVLEGARVRLYNATDSTLYDQTVTTDVNGKYSFTNVVPGTYYLVVSGGNGYINQTEKITIQ